MKRLSRHTVVVLLVALGGCLGGMSLAVGAFGQSGGDPDATVPLGDYTQTTPATPTEPLSSYTTTSPTTTPSTSQTTPTDTGEGLPATTNGSKPETTHGKRDVSLPSKATRSGPTHLAFTGGEPIIVGAAGVALMLGGLALHRRRRQHPAA